MPITSSTTCEVAEKPTKGVPSGPEISASQVKKSDSEIGPICQIAGLHQQYSNVFVDIPAVNIPSGEPGKLKPSECQLYDSQDTKVTS